MQVGKLVKKYILKAKPGGPSRHLLLVALRESRPQAAPESRRRRGSWCAGLSVIAWHSCRDSRGVGDHKDRPRSSGVQREQAVTNLMPARRTKERLKRSKLLITESSWPCPGSW